MESLKYDPEFIGNLSFLNKPAEHQDSSILIPKTTVYLEPQIQQNQLKRASFVSKSSNSAGTLISVKEEDKNFFHTEKETPCEYDDKGR